MCRPKDGAVLIPAPAWWTLPSSPSTMAGRPLPPAAPRFLLPAFQRLMDPVKGKGGR